MKRYSVFLLVTLASFVMAATVVAEVPNVISYQGRLTNSDGTPIADGSYTVVFTIYDAATGGTSKWTEAPLVTTSGGLFSVLLGSVAPISDTVFSGTTRYLGIMVGADPELTPRTVLVAVPYAHRVSTVDGAAGGTISGNTAIQNNLSVSGNVGIGTATPLRKLHIGTGTTVNNVFSDVLLNFADGDDHYYEVTNTSGFGLFGMGGSNTNIVGSGNLRFSPGAHTAVTMTPAGDVGVGTTSPLDKLHVVGTVRADQFRGPLVVNSGSITYAADGGDHIFTAGTLERMRITTATGDAATALPTDAISATEMLNEPGIATAAITYTITLSAGDMQDMVTVSITIPAAGYIVVNGSGVGYIYGSAVVANYANFQIDEFAGGGASAPYVQRFGYQGAPSSGISMFPFYVTRTYYKVAGTYTFRVEGYKIDAAGQAYALNVTIQAMYIPTAYGSVFAASTSPTGVEGERAEKVTDPNGQQSTIYVTDLRQLELKAAKAEAEAERLRRQVLEEKLKQQGESGY